jgi:cell division transport system permease protein
MTRRNKSSKHNRGLQAVTLCISTAMVLILIGMVVFSVMTAHNLSRYVKENFVVTMTLEDDMTKPEAQLIIKSLDKKIYINRIEFISKEQALKEQTEAMGTDPTEFIGANPFMASIELCLQGDYANSDSLHWIQKELKKYPKVSEITYQKDLMDNVNSNLQKINIVLLVLALLLTFVSFSLINNTVRLGIYARRFNIHTMKLVGASWGFIRRPFISQSMWIGLLAAILADSVLAGMLYILYMYQPNMLTVVTWEVMVITGCTVLIFGLLLTWICTVISVNKFLKMKAGQLYKI